MEMAQAVIDAAKAQRAPVMIQTMPGTLRYAAPATYTGIIKSLAERSSVPIRLHLDHSDSFDLASKCLIAGYTSVMIDGNRLSYEENIELSKRVVVLTDLVHVAVEAELGKVSSKEDDFNNRGKSILIRKPRLFFGTNRYSFLGCGNRYRAWCLQG